MESCFICGDAALDAASSGISIMYGSEVLSRSIIWSDNDLILIPAPGALVPGYLILAPRKHQLRFSECPESVIAKVGSVYQHIKEVGKSIELGGYLMFEHGGQNLHNKGASCVLHAHLHFCPCNNPHEIRDTLRSVYHETKLDGLHQLVSWSKSPSYVLLAFEDSYYLYATPKIESQFIRRELARQWGIEDQWDWRIYRFPSNYLKTLDMYSTLLHQYLRHV